jgi:hypothetical protein
MIHDITLADPSDPQSPPETVVRLAAVDDLLWIYIQKHDSDNKGDHFETIAEQCVSLPAIREALELIRHDVERERARPVINEGDNARGALLTGLRKTEVPL